MTNEDGLWAAVATAVTMATWTPNTVKSIRLWRDERSPRSFRGMFLSVMIFLGLVRILIGSLNRAFPANDAIDVVNLATAPVLTLLLLSGGLVTWYTWRRMGRM